MSVERLSARINVSACVRPSDVCRALLYALDAAEGRRKQRKRDQTPDAIGLGAKRELLECAVREDPAPDAFEEWLLRYLERRAGLDACGTASAMARAVFEEWRLAHTLPEFATWLEVGAPSEDTENTAPTRAPASAPDRPLHE